MNEGIKSASTAPAKVSELERLAGAVAKQRELIRELEAKLDVVSNRGPISESSAQPNERVHLSVIIDHLADNNRELARLQDELAI